MTKEHPLIDRVAAELQCEDSPTRLPILFSALSDRVQDRYRAMARTAIRVVLRGLHEEAPRLAEESEIESFRAALRTAKMEIGV